VLSVTGDSASLLSWCSIITKLLLIIFVKIPTAAIYHNIVSEWILNSTSAQGYTVPFTLVHAGKYRKEDKLKTDSTKVN